VGLASCAGAMGWGIRGQYGHETGAMIAGLLAGLVLVGLLVPGASSLAAGRAVAWCTAAMGIGGCMTYGQTVGLTHDPALVGNWPALWWGMLGLAVKGGVWIGFGALFLGMGLGGVRYSWRSLLGLVAAMLALYTLGVWLLNEPYDPARRQLPWLYFSDHWRWEPDADLRPRRGVWGGLWCALLGALAYVGRVRRDGLAVRLAGWGVLGGALGFPLGQSLQAFHAWNPDFFAAGWAARLDVHLNWWNWMETTFGATFGALLGLGLWLHRSRIAPPREAEAPSLTPVLEWALVIVHVPLLVAAELLDLPWAGWYSDYSLVLALIPLVAVASGRIWPWLLMLPITVLPIAGKSLRHLVYEEAAFSPLAGWVLLLVVPLVGASAAAAWANRKAQSGAPAGAVLPPLLLLCTWLYFGLNYAFFRFPWPWAPWTARTPNAIVFTVCAVVLTVGAVVGWRRRARLEGGDQETG